MPISANEVALAPFGNVLVAPVGTPLPTNASSAMNQAFRSVGYINEDGVSITPQVDLTDIKMWQSVLPVKTAIESVSLEVKFVMGQVNTVTWGLYFFNNTFTNNAGQAAMTMSSNPATQERSLIVEWDDEFQNTQRLVVPRAVLADREALNLVRNQAQTTGITLRVLDNSGNFAFLYSENTNLLPGT